MVDIQRQRVRWSGFVGAPGISTFYFEDAAGHQSALKTFLDAIKTCLPSDVHMLIEPDGDVIDAATGDLTGAWTGTNEPESVGTESGGYAAPAGFQTRWNTGSIFNNHRVRGRTFWVPAASSVEQSDGSMVDSARATMETASNTFVAAVSGNLKVWVRPRRAQVAYTDGFGRPHGAITAADGASATVTSATVPDRLVILASRRG